MRRTPCRLKQPGLHVLWSRQTVSSSTAIHQATVHLHHLITSTRCGILISYLPRKCSSRRCSTTAVRMTTRWSTVGLSFWTCACADLDWRFRFLTRVRNCPGRGRWRRSPPGAVFASGVETRLCAAHPDFGSDSDSGSGPSSASEGSEPAGSEGSGFGWTRSGSG